MYKRQITSRGLQDVVKGILQSNILQLTFSYATHKWNQSQEIIEACPFYLAFFNRVVSLKDLAKASKINGLQAIGKVFY